MLLERYVYESDESFLQYEFFSDGPKGKIKKVVVYSHIGERYGENYYNIGFGDWNEEEQRIDDLTTSNNKDRDKILATVAASALDFTDHFPKCKIYAEGSTLSRTRLYQIGIATNFEEISTLFEVEGWKSDEGWVTFSKGENYTAFLVTRR